MNRKIIIISIFAAVIFVGLSFVAAGLGGDVLSYRKSRRESPLYKIRTMKALKEKIEKIKTNFLELNLENRIFLRYNLAINKITNQMISSHLCPSINDDKCFTNVEIFCTTFCKE
jgi:hypothetical protein